ncbi:MAG TPA: hypothetical protein VFC00_30765 [Micromonosporaceae bacterium]|nr:hypothetical protein [Micromonosporaceae bacterium]
MPSYDQLDNEAAWRDEYEPPALKVLAAGLRAHWPGCGVWIRGDNDHLRGYHRSRRWIKESIYCTDRSYSVSRTTGDRSGGDPNWACALDLGNLSQAELMATCRRLDEAVRAGRLEKITEWYGNLGGDTRVDGWDNIADRLASADSSHLTHLHMSFDRGRANEDHSDVLAILTGVDDMEQTDPLIKPTGANRSVGEMYADTQNLRNAFIGDGPVALGSDGKPIPGYPKTGSPLDNMARLPQLLKEHASAPIDPAALAAALQPSLDAMEARLNARIDAVAVDARDAVGDLGEGGSAKVREDKD